ncbi:MAG: response regulator transcription factor [Rhodobacteraceae bacterium]|nr:response regulator transcription factor [Paracoccaceae bacterium]
MIFILEDDRQLAAILARTFEEHGFETETFGLIRNLERRLSQIRPALCFVDMRLPDGEGLDLTVRRLRKQKIPVIMMSGVWTEIPDRVIGLEMGADDYLVKPFSPREAVARAKAVLRRAESSDGAPSLQVARFNGWTVDLASHRLTAPDGHDVEVSTGDVRLLQSFLSMPQRVLTRETLMESCGDSTAVFDRSIDVRVSRLRQKLGEDPRHPRIIKTVHGAGYMFAAKVEWLEGQRN